MSKPVTVGRLREATALSETEKRVIIVSDDEAVKRLHLEVVEVFPDTTNADGTVDSSFKIKVQLGELA